MKKQFRIIGVIAAFLVLVGGLILPTQASPPEAAPAPQGMQSMPGTEVVFLYDGRYTPYHVPPPEQAALGIQAATINVTWNPPSCPGAVAPWPSNAQTAFSYAVNIWASLINSSQTIEVDACWRTDMIPIALGSAGPTTIHKDFPNAPLTNTWYPVTLANSLANTDLNSGNPEIRANFNSTYSWYYGTDGNTPPAQMDFVTVVLHELCHGLGFLGSMDVSVGLGSWGFGIGPPYYPAIYDRFAEDNSGTALLNYTNFSAALASALTSNNVYFDGTNANAANGGARVKLYAPGTWASGSSYSHLDEIFNGTPNALMTYSGGPGESLHNPGPIVLGMFQDMGWTVTSGASGDSYEPDNAYTDASTITVNGAAQHHTFHQSGDEDWAKFTVTASETYTITTSNLGTNADTILELYDTNGTSLLDSNDDCPGGGLESCINGWSDPDAGTYFIRVLQVGGTGGATGYEYDLAVVSSGGGTGIYLPIISKPSTTNWYITNNTGGTLTVQLSGVGTKQFGSGTSLWVVPSGSHDVYITTTGCGGVIDKTYDFPAGGDRYDIYTCG